MCRGTSKHNNYEIQKLVADDKVEVSLQVVRIWKSSVQGKSRFSEPSHSRRNS